MRILTIFVSLLGVLSTALAQNPTPSGVAPAPDYRLQEEDVIFITLAEETERNMQATVGTDGFMSYPYIGQVKIKNRTVAEIKEEIEQRLVAAGILVEPTVNITVVNFRKPRATVIGQETMRAPNQYEFRPGQRLRDLIGLAGGPVAGVADMRGAIFQRKDSPEQVPIDLRTLIQEGRDDQNYLLKDGDQLIVPRDEKGYITVAGEVNSPGPQGFREGMRMTEAIANAKGGTFERGQLTKVTIFRTDPYNPAKQTKMKVNYFEALQNPNKDIVLERQDFVLVPKTNNLDTTRFKNMMDTLYITTVLLRANPFDALTNALR